MKEESFFYKNIDILKKKNIEVPFEDYPIKHLEFCETEKGELNIKDTNCLHYYHSQSGALEEAKEWFLSLQLDGVQVIYVYGIGLGYYYDVAKRWLNEDKSHFIAFIEDDINVYRRFLECDRATDIIEDKQVTIFYLKEDEDINRWSDRRSWQFAGSVIEVSALTLYKKEIRFMELRLSLISCSVSTQTVIKENKDWCGLPFYENFYRNAYSIGGKYQGDQLFGKFKNIPMVICGAGPSLSKNCIKLKDIGGKALILAGGSAMNVLSHYQITPHFGGGVDPTVVEKGRFLNHYFFEIAVFCINRLYHGAMKSIHGPTLFLGGSEDGYHIQEWFREVMNFPYVDHKWGGCSVLTFCAQVAVALGCNPIIFLGADLANTNMRRYAFGVGLNDYVDEDKLSFCENTWNGALWRKDIYDKPVCTQWKWMIESNWFSEFAKKYPEIQFINATEGGIGFQGVINLSFNDVIRRYLTKQYDLKNKIHTYTQNLSRLEVDCHDVTSAFEDMKGSLERSISILSDMGDALKVQMFSEIGTSYLKPFKVYEQQLVEKMEVLRPEHPEYEKVCADLKKVEENIRCSLEIGTNLLKQLVDINSRWKDKDETPHSLITKFTNELSYKYILKSIDTIFLLQSERRKYLLRCPVDSPLIDKMSSMIKQTEVDIEKICLLKKAAKASLSCLTNIINQESNVF